MAKGFFSVQHAPVHRRLVGRLTANGTLALPARAHITGIWIEELAGNAVTGGIKIGTTNGGTEVLGATAVAASSLQGVNPAGNALSKNAQTLYIQAVTAWNNASIRYVIAYREIAADA